MADRVGVVGLGHIGGSLALALPGCLAWSRSAGTREAAAAAGVDVAPSLADLVAGVDLVVLAPALPALPAVVDDVAAVVRELPGSPTITDVGSVKAPIAAHAARVLPDPSAFVPGHPLAGGELTGWPSADPGIFAGTTWALSVDEPVDLDRWWAVAGRLCELDVAVVPTANQEHDRILAITSHLPYLLAGLVARRLDGWPQAAVLSGGSLAGLTRVVSTEGGARFGGEMAAANHAQLATVAEELAADLADAGRRLRSEDPSTVGALLASWVAAEAAPPEVLDRPDRTSLLDLGRAGGRIVDVGPSGITVRRGSTT